MTEITERMKQAEETVNRVSVELDRNLIYHNSPHLKKRLYMYFSPKFSGRTWKTEQFI